jgi:hypothetical protein
MLVLNCDPLKYQLNRLNKTFRIDDFVQKLSPNAILPISPIFGNFLWQFFLVIVVFVLQKLKKVEFRVGTTLLTIFSQNDVIFEKSTIWLKKKIYKNKKKRFERSQGFWNRLKIEVLRSKLRKFWFLTPFWTFRPFCQTSKSKIGFLDKTTY